MQAGDKERKDLKNCYEVILHEFISGIEFLMFTFLIIELDV